MSPAWIIAETAETGGRVQRVVARSLVAAAQLLDRASGSPLRADSALCHDCL